jgi:four helix bundle protein
MYFDHERLDVYRVAMELAVLVDEIIEQFPRGRGYLADQLHRAGASVLLNIAEGAGEYSENEKMRFYRIARRSGTETAAILELGKNLKMIEEAKYRKSRELLIRIISMLTRMTREPATRESVTVTPTVTVTN